MVNRREFIGTAFASGAFAAFGIPDAKTRIARIGMMTDTHVLTTMESCSRVRAALELFKAKGVEMVINCGDLADNHYPDGYRCYRKTVDSVYPDKASRPKEVYVYAFHDICNYKPGSGWNVGHAAAAFEDMRRLLEAPNGHTASFVWKGLPFAIFPQSTGHKDFLTWEDYEKTVARLCAENPGKPVFVCDHVPPAGTTFHSWHWGSENCRRVLNKYPQVVSISGHVHGSVASERQIWQGEFTAINLGCLQTWGGFAPGSTPPHQAKPNFGVLVMDVFNDRLVVYRHDVRDGSEVASPWVVPLPFAAQTAPFRPAAAALRQKERPLFAASAAVSVKPVDSPVSGYSISFDEVAKGPRAFMYRLECHRMNADGNWEPFTRDDVFADFWIAPKDRTGRAEYRLSAGFFAPGGKYRVTVTPLDFFYRPSPAISAEFTATHAAPKTTWRSDDQFAFRFTEYGRSVERDAAGFFTPSSGQGTLHLPDGAFANLVPGKRHRFVFDIHLSQPVGEYCAWRVALAPKDKWPQRFGEVQTSPGDPGVLRYVIEFTPDANFPSSCSLVMNYRSRGARVKLLAAEVQQV